MLLERGRIGRSSGECGCMREVVAMGNLPQRTNTGFRFWPVMWFLLILGLVAGGIKALWQPDAATGIGLLLGIGLWSGALALCALLLRLLSNATYFLQALGAMWRPLVLTLAAAYLLFLN